MFAILVSHENVGKIIESQHEGYESLVKTLKVYLASEKEWYFVRGQKGLGAFLDWSIMPLYMIEGYYEINIENAKTDWDQIVRK